jgi:hypothetical protein
MLPLALVLLALVSTNGQEPQKGARPSPEERLKKIARVEDATLFVDLGPRSFVPNEWPRRMGQEGMRLLASEMVREWKEVNGVQVMLRRRGPDALTGYQSVKGASVFLGSLTDAQLAALLRCELGAGEISPDVLDALTNHMSGGTPTSRIRMAESPTSIRLGMIADYEITVSDSTSGRSEKRMVQRPMKDPVKKTDREIRDDWSPLGKPKGGALDFGDGELLGLDVLLARASKTFGKSYYFDARLTDTQFFVSGSYDEETFNRIVALHTALPPVQPFTEQFDTMVRQLWDLLSSKAVGMLEETQGVDGAERKAKGEATSLKEIASQFPEAYGVFKSNGFKDQDLATIRLRMRIVADPGTKTVVGEGVHPGTTSRYQVLTPDYSYIWLPTKPGG